MPTGYGDPSIPRSCRPHGFMGSSPILITPSQTSDSSTDRIPGYEPDDVGSIPPLTTISQVHKVGMTGPVIHGRAGRPPLHLVPATKSPPILDTLNSTLSYPTFALLHRSSAPLCTFALTDRPLVPMSPCHRASMPPRASACPPCPRAHVSPQFTGP